MEKKITELSKIRREFPNKNFSSANIKQAGKILKTKGPDEVRNYFTNTPCLVGDFQPPVKTNIIAKSRPFEEWPISIASKSIQEYYFSLTKNELELVHPGLSKEEHEKFFNTTGLKLYKNVQGLNLIFKHAKSMYDGVLVKSKNKNIKLIKKYEKINSFRKVNNLPDIIPELKDPFDLTGHLLNPPGINNNIYCYCGCSPKPFLQDKYKNISLPKEYEGYDKNPNINLIVKQQSRLEIPEGEPGHVPWFQRLEIPEGHIGYVDKVQRFGFISGKNSGKVKFSNKTGRIKKYHHSKYKNPNKPYKFLQESIVSSAINSILAVICIGEDWVVFDIRGLYRDVLRRKVISNEITTQQLLNLFTGDPVIDPKKNIITFIYKEGVVPIFSQNIVSRYKSREVLEKLSLQSPLTLISVDLGQNEPISYRAFKINNINEPLLLENSYVISDSFRKDIKKQIQDYRNNVDSLELKLKTQATQQLPIESQIEINNVDNLSCEKTKDKIIYEFGINPDLIPWDKLSSYTTYIADLYLQNGGDESKVYFNNENKKQTIKLSDYNISKLFRLKLSVDIRKSLNEEIWKLKKSSSEFIKLSKRKLELSRSIVNRTIKEAVSWSGNNNLAIIIEDLDILQFHGYGKRDIGWNNFFNHKKENRWFMQELHKSFSELSSNKGLCVIEINPAWTSVTCPDCGFSSKDNRDGIDFICLNCGKHYHADIDVATINIARVAILGKPIKHIEECERLGDAKIPVVARGRKQLKSKKILNKPTKTKDSDQ